MGMKLQKLLQGPCLISNKRISSTTIHPYKQQHHSSESSPEAVNPYPRKAGLHSPTLIGSIWTPATSGAEGTQILPSYFFFFLLPYEAFSNHFSYKQGAFWESLRLWELSQCFIKSQDCRNWKKTLEITKPSSPAKAGLQHQRREKEKPLQRRTLDGIENGGLTPSPLPHICTHSLQSK